MGAQTIDSFEFCRSAAQASGTTPVAEFKRLCADLADASGEMRWSFQGGLHPEGDPQLTMDVAGTVRLVCQRCMAPFDYSLQSRSVLVLAADEEQADAGEQRLDDDSIDVIVGSKGMDLLMRSKMRRCCRCRCRHDMMSAPARCRRYNRTRPSHRSRCSGS